MTRGVCSIGSATLVFSAALCGTAMAATATFDVQEAKKTCLERYNAEQESRTIPAGMSKSKYVGQCVNSMRRNAEMEKDLAEQNSAAAGSNELTASTGGKTGTTPAQSKPAGVPTPAFNAPKTN